MAKVSVIIPVYRSEKYLPACLDSVLKQDVHDLEVICIDDASDDGCADILDSYAEKDKRIKVIHLPENRGQEHARNLGLNTASGEYVYFLDSDDEIVGSALKQLCARCESERLQGIFFDSATVAETAELAQQNRFYKEKRTGLYPTSATSGKELFSLFVSNKEWEVYVQRQFWRRDYLMQSGVRFPEGIIHGDEFFSCAAIVRAERVLYVPEQYVLRRFRAGSITETKSPRRDVVGYFTDYCGTAGLLAEMPDLRALAVNATHLRELTCRFFKKMSREEQRINLFAGTPLEKEYAFFMHDMSVVQAESEWYRELFASLPDCASVVVYGAGTIAELFARRLHASGKGVRRYVVSNGRQHPARFCGCPVVSYDELDLKDDEIVVIAMSEEAAAEVSASLSRDGIEHFIYDGRNLCHVQL